MSAKKPPTIAVLWGDQARAMSWVELHDDGRQESIGHADPNGFWMRNTTDRELGRQVFEVWNRILVDQNDEWLAQRATHRIATELDRCPIVEVIPKGTLKSDNPHESAPIQESLWEPSSNPKGVVAAS